MATPKRANPIADTFNRLLEEAVNTNYFEREDSKFQEFFHGTLKTTQEVAPELDSHQQYALTTAAVLSNRFNNLEIELAVHRKILQVLMEYLHESSHRQALQVLAKLTLKDVIRSSGRRAR